MCLVLFKKCRIEGFDNLGFWGHPMPLESNCISKGAVSDLCCKIFSDKKSEQGAFFKMAKQLNAQIWDCCFAVA